MAPRLWPASDDVVMVLVMPTGRDDLLTDCAGATARAVVTSAFVHDPVERWLYPELEAYLREFPRFVEALGGRAIEAETAWTADDDAAVALWLPPGVSPDDDQIVEVLTSTVAVEKHEDMFLGLEQMSAMHPVEPHWYLAWLAVADGAQGRGLGDRLLSRCLVHVDASHLPVYLETPNPRNVPFYERHGFRVVGRTETRSCPPITFMSRPGRAA